LKIDATDQVALLVAVYNGDPAGPGPGDEQIRNRYGLNFRVRDPALTIGEAQFRTNHHKDDTGLARTLKLGGWMHFGNFADQHIASDGSLLADPSGSGTAAMRRGNFGVYGVIEQQLYRPSGGDATSGISLFSRISVSPSDRNPIDFFIDGGIVVANVVPQRPEDKFGISAMLSRFSNALRAFDRDQIAFTGLPGVVRDYEANIELTYLAQIVPGWTVQSVLTHVWHPRGDRHRNATVMGGRSVWRY